MAQRYPNRTTMNVSDSKWKLTDDLPEGTEVKPASGDDVDLTVNSGVVTQDEDCPTSGALNSFAMAGGQWIDAAFDVFAAGDILISGGTLTSTGTWTMTESGNLDCRTPNTLGGLVISPTKTASFLASTRSVWIDARNATLANSVAQLTLFPLANDFLLVDGDTEITGAGRIVIQHSTTAGVLTQAAIEPKTFTPTELRIQSNITSRSFQMTGNLNINTKKLSVYSLASQTTLLDLNDNDLTCGQVIVGSPAGVPRNGSILCGSGTHNIASLAMGNDANTGNALTLETCNLFSTGIIDGNSEDTNPMTITSVGANLHGGTLLDAAVSGPLHCWGVTKSGVVTDDAMDEGSNAGAALGGMHSMIGMAA